MIIVVNVIGLLLIAVVVYWFWLSQPKVSATLSTGVIEIIVNNGVYQPAAIRVAVNQQITLRFIRKTESPCAAIVMFPELDISEELPIGKAKDVHLKLSEKGVYAFTCEMAMYRGSITVE